MKKQYVILLVTSLVLVFDVFTKRMIMKWLTPHESIDILPFLKIVHVQNEGAAFGLFTSFGNRLFIVISLIAILVIVLYLIKIQDRLEIFSISLILGGAAGNLLDRLTVGKVIDFMDFFISRWHWPAFNVADSALTIGIMLFFISQLRRQRQAA